MNKRVRGKKLGLHTETLRRLEPKEINRVQGGEIDVRDLPSWNSDCIWGTCGPNSCLGFCTLARCDAQ